MRTRRGRLSGESGQATLEHIGVLGVVAVVILAVVLAFTANAPGIGAGAARLICEVLTLGTGSCGSAAAAAESREPTTPCAVRGESDNINAGIGFTVVGVGANRSFAWEEYSDGTYRVTSKGGGDATVVTGVGAQLAFTVADTDFGAGASAGLSGGVVFESGSEWTVDSPEALERLVSAENWSRVDTVVGAVGPLGPVGSQVLPQIREFFGIGETFPSPERTFVAAGTTAEASAYAGAGIADGGASVGGSRLLGWSTGPDGEQTYYYETTVDASAAAGIIDLGGNQGASLSGEVTTMTSLTLDRDYNVVRASRSGLAAGESAGLTNALFGGEFTTSTTDGVGTGTQYDATLVVRDDADRAAALSLIAGIPVDALGVPVRSADPSGTFDPTSALFMAAVRDRGDLTRTQVTPQSSTPFAADVSVEAGLIAGLSGSYSTASMEYANPEYFDGTGYVPRTTC